MSMNRNPFSQYIGPAASIIGGLFGDSGAPYEAAMDQYQDFMNRAEKVQNPFINAGTNAIPQFQEWLSGMKDPSAFINNLMGQYKESPYARYQQQQAMRAARNAGSASGLTGSTPLLQQMQQNAANISSQDMNSWLQNVLGINTQYGQGVSGLINTGQNSANALTNMYGDMGRAMAEAAYGREAGDQNDLWNVIGGAASLLLL